MASLRRAARSEGPPPCGDGGRLHHTFPEVREEAVDNLEQRFSLRHICMADALQYAEEDNELLRQLAELFLSEAPRQVEAVNRALEADDYAQAARAAHMLKGSIAALAAEQVHQHARQVETLLRRQVETGDEDQKLQPQWRHLQREVAELCDEAQQMAEGLGAAGK